MRASAVEQLAAAREQVLVSAATYRQLVGHEPGRLRAASPLSKLLPASLDAALVTASREHPTILASEHLIDAAAFSVKSAERALLPQLSASAGVSSAYSNTSPIASQQDGTTNSASIGAKLTIPIYSGGRASALVRQNKESLSQVIAAAQLALNGVVEERDVGQRTTLDVLNAQAQSSPG